MKPAPRVEQRATPLLQKYSNCLGIASADSSLYVFYPHTIKVYEDLCQGQMPQLSSQLIISQGKIVNYAVNLHYIVMLFEDSKLEVRSREYWEKVQYSFNLSQESKKIRRIQIKAKTIVLSLDNEDSTFTYMFIKFSENQKQVPAVVHSQAQIEANVTSVDYKQIVHLEQLGNIRNFYLGLTNNQIRFGTYYKTDSQLKNISQFQFGRVKEENENNIVHFFALINQSTQIKRTEQFQKTDHKIYLVKLISQDSKQDKNSLSVKYRKFYQSNSNKKIENDPQEEVNLEQKRVEAYKKMMNTLLQINNVTQNEIESETKQRGNDHQSKLNESFCIKKGSSKIDIVLNKNENFHNFVQNNNEIYFATNKRIFKFVITNDQKGIIEQVCKLQKEQELISAFQDKLYVSLPCLYIRSNKGQFIGRNQKEAENFKVQNLKNLKKSLQTQTEALSDVLLQQFQQKQLSEMIDDLLKKKQIAEVQVQTQLQNSVQKQEKGELVEEQKIQKKRQQQVKQISNDKGKSLTQISIGGSIPMCPDSHETTLLKIKSVLQSQTDMHNKTIKNMSQLIKSQQQKAKTQILRKIDSMLGATITNNVIPLVQEYIRKSFETKLSQINIYLYSLATQNLLLLKQEIQRDEAKENMIRQQLIKRQFHEVAQSKRAVAEMMQICKKRQLQKIVFFQEVKKKFTQIENKVLQLEQKIKSVIQGEQVNEAKLFDEVQLIKSMINHHKSRKKSVIIQEKKAKNQQQVLQSQSQSQQKEDSLQNSQYLTESQFDSSVLSSQIKHSIAVMKTQTIQGRPIYSTMQNPYNMYQNIQPQLGSTGFYPQMQQPFVPFYTQPPSYPFQFAQPNIYPNYQVHSQIPSSFNTSQLPQLPQMSQLPHVSQIPSIPHRHLSSEYRQLSQIPQLQVSEHRHRFPQFEIQRIKQKSKQKSKQKNEDEKIKKKKKKKDK